MFAAVKWFCNTESVWINYEKKPILFQLFVDENDDL